MHILGLSNGSIHGNSEILLKAALEAAVAADPSITTSWLHVPSIVIPRNPKPLRVDKSVIPEGASQAQAETPSTEADDRRVVLEAILDADGLIIASPVYTHQPPATLKELCDKILGPYADNAKAFRKLAKKEAGDPDFQNVEIDAREVKPRVAAFIAVAGSNLPFTEQWTMALPTMHLVTYPIHAKVIDQVILPGNANAGAVLIRPTVTVDRARTLGERVASQIGKAYDKAAYLGPEEKGACPYCHLLKVEFRTGNTIQCIVCGAYGQLQAGDDGDIRPVWTEDSDVSSLTLKGKWKHLDDVGEQLALERRDMPSVREEMKRWQQIPIPQVELPSGQR